jgi:hypothetical protein
VYELAPIGHTLVYRWSSKRPLHSPRSTPPRHAHPSLLSTPERLMFSAVLGLFSQDLAVDLGTSETRIHQRGTGLVCREPSVIAVHTDRNGHRRVAAVGSEAVPMIGRTPADLQAVQPVQHGHVVDFEVAEALLTHLVRQVHGRNQWVAPKMVLATPWGATDMERTRRPPGRPPARRSIWCRATRRAGNRKPGRRPRRRRGIHCSAVAVQGRGPPIGARWRERYRHRHYAHGA